MEEAQFNKALGIYRDHKLSPQESSTLILQNFVPIESRNYLLSYLLAIAYANGNRYEEFMNYFYSAYLYYPNHYLSYKTQAILHIKLMERKRTEVDRSIQRDAIIMNFESALAREPYDVSLYKLLINFSSPEKKPKQVRQCLNKILEGTMIIPRSDLLFYVREAVDAKEMSLAQKFIDKARGWYPDSRLVSNAQEYLTQASR